MKTFKKLLLIYSIFLITFFGEIAVNLACGGEIDPYDYYISYFHNNIEGDEYKPFAFNQMSYLNSEEDIESEAEINSREWGQYLGVNQQDVFKVMYQTDSATSAKLTQISGNIAELPDSLRQNSFLAALSKHGKAMNYYTFAKRCEPLANVAYDPWDPAPRDTTAMSVLAREAQKLAKSTRDRFLKLRYAYQAERMFHYAGMHEDSKAVYEKFIQHSKVSSAVNGWALALYAGSVRRLGSPDASAYLFSKVFASNPERRIQAYKNYYYNSAVLNNVLGYAKTDEERANIWAINGFGNPEFDTESLNKVYQYDAKSALNGVLLVREVNKLEQAMIESKDIARVSYSYYFGDSNNTNYRDSVKLVNLKHLHTVRDFALKIAGEKKYPEPAVGTLTAAYLSWIENDDAQALKYLGALNPDKLPTKLRDQYRITDLLVQANNITKGRSFDEQALLPTLKWLDQKQSAESELEGERHFSKTARNFYQQILAPAYLKLNDTARAALAMAKSDQMGYQSTRFWQQYLSPKTMSELLKYRSKAAGNDLLAFLAIPLKQMNNDDFYELYGTTYLRQHQYEKAVQMFAKVSAAYQFLTPENWYADDENAKLYSNPFVETVNDYPKKKASAKSAINKKTFAKEMLRLQKLLVSDKKNAALYYYQMANAVYQTGYYGNSWYLISYTWSVYDYSMPATNTYDIDYIEAKTAKSWYLKARALSTDENFKAKCTFMLAKCEQKRMTTDSQLNMFNFWDEDDARYKSFISANYNNAYFKELKTKYSKTPFYQIAAGECSYLRDFIARK